MEFSRRKFIISSVLSTAGLTVFSTPLSYPANFISSLTDPNIEALLSQAASARSNGDYVLSENIYNQVISLVPEEIRAYFGLRKTYLTQKHKEYNVVRLFEQAVNSNPENIRLICQLAKEYTSVALGNKQVEQMLNYETPLLEMAQDLYNLALSLNPEDPSPLARGGGQEDQSTEGGDNGGSSDSIAEVGLEKVETKIDQQAGVVDARDNPSMKTQRRSHQVTFKNRFNELSDSQLASKLNTLKAKPDAQKRAKHIKELYRLNINRKKVSDDYLGACTLAYQLHLFDKDDTNSLGLYRKLALRANQFAQLTTVMKNNDILQGTFWSKLGYFDALKRQYEASPNTTIRNSATTTINQLIHNFNLTPLMNVELGFRKLEMSFMNQNLPEAKNNLIEIGNLLFGSLNPHDAVRFSKAYSKYFVVTQQRDLAMKFIDLLINPENPVDELLINQDSLNKIIVDYNSNVMVEKAQHLDQLYKLREKLYSNSTL